MELKLRWVQAAEDLTGPGASAFEMTNLQDCCQDTSVLSQVDLSPAWLEAPHNMAAGSPEQLSSDGQGGRAPILALEETPVTFVLFCLLEAS